MYTRKFGMVTLPGKLKYRHVVYGVGEEWNDQGNVTLSMYSSDLPLPLAAKICYIS